VTELPLDQVIDLCRLEIEAIGREGGDDKALLKIRMDTIYVNLALVARAIGEGGHQDIDEAVRRQIKATFLALDREYDFAYDMSVL